MFQKHIVLFVSLIFFAACSNAEPVQENSIPEPTVAAIDQDDPSEEIVADAKVPQTTMEAPSAIKPEKNIPEPEQQTEIAESQDENKVEVEKGIVESVEAVANKPAIITPVSTIEAAKLSHESWNALLQKYVTSSGKVDYAGFSKEKEKLQAYLDLLAANPVQKSWSGNEQMAYWINAYNAFTVKLIIDHMPVKSITNIHSGKPWSKKWIKLGDQTYSLDQIENEILRPQFKDARIHFAVNCAAQSCPPLLNKAWTADNLESNFETQAKKFINNPKFNILSEKKVQISKIFEWYSADFGDIVTYLNKYSEVEIKSNAKVTYLEYDWALND